MLFDLNGSKLMVKFWRVGDYTNAELWQFNNDFGEYDCLNLLGTAICSMKDRFEKSRGRKIALAKLLNRMNQTSAGDNEPEFNLSKEDRARIWEIYFKEHKK